jgi:hypothetical protein
MTNSQNRLILAAVLCAGISLAGLAHAQTNAPVTPEQLQVPGAATQPPASTLSITPLPQAGSAPRRLVPNAAPRSLNPAENYPVVPSDVRKTTGIEVDGLTRIDGDSLGALRQQDGGLGADMWQGTTRMQAVDLVSGMPLNTGSKTLRKLKTRLLLSRARAPIAASDDVPSLLSARVNALMAMGDVENAELLLSVSPTQGRPDGLDAADASIQLLKFDNARACGLARNNQRHASKDFWQKMLIYCDALDGKAESVSFGLSLLRETSGDDPALALLADSVLSGVPITLESIANPTTFHLALSRASKTKLPPDVTTTNNALVLYGATTAPNLILGSKIEAAEKGVAGGIIDPRTLRRLYSEVNYADADLDNALTRADEIGGQAARALLYQAAAKQNIPVARGEIINAALAIAREDARYLPVVEAFKPLIDRIPPSPEMGWFAITAVRGYLTLGDRVGTEKWMALLRASATVNPAAQLALDHVRPLAWVLGAGADRVNLNEMLSAWRQSIEERPELIPTQSLLNAIVLALGAELPKTAWDGSLKSEPQSVYIPSASEWLQFRDVMLRWNTMVRENAERRLQVANVSGVTPVAASEESMFGVAEPVIRMLNVMGDIDAGPRSTHVIYEAIFALRQMGLIDDARQLAVENLIAAGL